MATMTAYAPVAPVLADASHGSGTAGCLGLPSGGSGDGQAPAILGKQTKKGAGKGGGKNAATPSANGHFPKFNKDVSKKKAKPCLGNIEISICMYTVLLPLLC